MGYKAAQKVFKQWRILRGDKVAFFKSCFFLLGFFLLGLRRICRNVDAVGPCAFVIERKMGGAGDGDGRQGCRAHRNYTEGHPF